MENLLFSRRKSTNLVRLPTSEGIGPVNLFAARLNVCKLVSDAMADDRVPVNKFVSKPKKLNFAS